MPCVLRAYLGVVVIVKRCLDGGTKIAGLIVFMAAAVGNNQVFHSARLDLPASASASVLLSVCPSDLSLPFFLSFFLSLWQFDTVPQSMSDKGKAGAERAGQFGCPRTLPRKLFLSNRLTNKENKHVTSKMRKDH